MAACRVAERADAVDLEIVSVGMLSQRVCGVCDEVRVATPTPARATPVLARPAPAALPGDPTSM